MSGPDFQDRLAEQQCKYRTVDLKYSGDKQFNVYTQHTTKWREVRSSALEHKKDDWEAEKHPRSRSKISGLCSNDIVPLTEYLASSKGSHNGVGRGKCVVCNKKCYWKCTL